MPYQHRSSGNDSAALCSDANIINGNPQHNPSSMEQHPDITASLAQCQCNICVTVVVASVPTGFFPIVPSRVPSSYGNSVIGWSILPVLRTCLSERRLESFIYLLVSPRSITLPISSLFWHLCRHSSDIWVTLVWYFSNVALASVACSVLVNAEICCYILIELDSLLFYMRSIVPSLQSAISIFYKSKLILFWKPQLKILSDLPSPFKNPHICCKKSYKGKAQLKEDTVEEWKHFLPHWMSLFIVNKCEDRDDKQSHVVSLMRTKRMSQQKNGNSSLALFRMCSA